MPELRTAPLKPPTPSPASTPPGSPAPAATETPPRIQGMTPTVQAMANVVVAQRLEQQICS